MKVVIASKSPVKRTSVERAFELLYPNTLIEFVCVDAKSGVSDQPMSDEETRRGALGRVRNAKELCPEGDIFIGLEGGSGDQYGDLHCFGWVVAESEGRLDFGRTFSFVIPPKVHEIMRTKNLELSHAVDDFFSKSGTKTGTGLIGPLTNDAVTYTDWYVHAAMSALLPFSKKDLY